MFIPNFGWGNQLAAVFGVILWVFLCVLAFSVAVAVIFLLVRFLLVGTRAAQLYIASTEPPRPAGPIVADTPAPVAHADDAVPAAHADDATAAAHADDATAAAHLDSATPAASADTVVEPTGNTETRPELATEQFPAKPATKPRAPRAPRTPRTPRTPPTD